MIATFLLLTALAWVGVSAPASGQDALPYKYAGHTLTNKFHRPSCAFAKAMRPDHIRLFHFRCQAVAAGYAPCRWCLPPRTLSVRGRIFKREETQNEARDNLHPEVETIPGDSHRDD